MRRMKLFLENWGFHAFLLPVFFIVHNYKQYYGLVRVSVAMKVGITILLIIFILTLILIAATKHLNRTLQLATLFGFVLLFYGVIKDFLQASLHAGILARYSVLIPLIIICTIFLTRIILRKENFRKSNLFQNILLLLFLLIDVTQLIVFSNSFFTQKNLLIKNNYAALGSIPIQNNRPDVYYLVFDSYPGTSFLNKYLNYDNSLFNKALEERGYYVVKNPNSNYNRTAFSIASTLNFQYLKDIKPFHRVGPKEYAQANLTVEKAVVTEFLKHQGYTIYNLSVFDIDTLPPIRKETFFTMPERDILLYNTLTERIKNDILWNFITGKYAVSFVRKFFSESVAELEKEQKQRNIFNHTIFDSVLKIPKLKTVSPRFVYAHFYLPHAPFFYDENGKKNDLKYIISEASLKNKDMFLSYLKYTNKVIEEVIDTIGNASGKKSVIVVQSDHGYRDYIDSQECYFANYSAFYFPDHNYSSLTDTLSNVNTFPIIINKFFKTNIPLRKDSTIFLAN